LASGIAIGFGGIGPSIGQAMLASSSCTAAGENKDAFNKIFTFSILSQAIIETPVIFCLIISMLLLFRSVPVSSIIPAYVPFLIASFTISFGTLGTAIGSGFTAAKSSLSIAKRPDHYTLLLRTSLLSQVIIESAAIYALIISLVITTKII
jgi:F-type H+-transporting ATPase subunit c